MSAGIGASVYDDRDYDTVYFNEELAHDFASWISGDSMEPKYQNGSVALIRETGFDYDGAVYAVVCNNQTYIKRVYREEERLRLVSINTKYKDIFISYDEDPRVVGIIVGNFRPWRDSLWAILIIHEKQSLIMHLKILGDYLELAYENFLNLKQL